MARYYDRVLKICHDRSTVYQPVIRPIQLKFVVRKVLLYVKPEGLKASIEMRGPKSELLENLSTVEPL